MPEATWRPASEAEAASTPAVFLEWLFAVRGVALGGFAALATWRRAEPAAFAAAISEFAGLDRGAGVREALLRGHGARTALVMFTADGARTWSRAELLAADALPEQVERMLACLAPADLPALAASHLLDVDTRPDASLVWSGDPADPWPLGAWLVGARIVLTASADATSRAPSWREYPLRPPAWRPDAP